MSVETVKAIKLSLLQNNVNLDGPCGAYQITVRTAWQLRGDGWGLVKSTGNGCDTPHGRFRADSIMKQDGTCVDILGLAENNNGKVYPEVPHESYNIPQFNSTGAQAPSNWFAPYEPDGVVIPPTPTPVPPDNGSSDDFEKAVMLALKGLYVRDDERKEQITLLSQQVEQLRILVMTMHYSFKFLGQTVDVAPRP